MSSLPIDDAVKALKDAGYRLIAPGQIDPDTVEKCAETVESRDRQRRPLLTHEVAAAIRALSQGGRDG